MPDIHVNALGKQYDIRIGDGLLDSAGSLLPLPKGRRLAVVADVRVAKLYAGRAATSFLSAGYLPEIIGIREGEGTKSHEVLVQLYNELAERGFRRSDAIVALGGGVTGDLAGFAAATYLRGLPLIMIPTTLLSQVDSSVGGKTAVNLASGKNLVGAFYQPTLVISDTSLLNTLEPRQLQSGLSEVIKYAAIADAELFDLLETLTVDSIRPRFPDIVARCCHIKKEYVQQDTLDTGVRMQLNFGHTLGHAIENAAGYGAFTHGEAVAAGMAAATRFGEQIGVTPSGTAKRLCALIKKYRLPTSSPMLPGMLEALSRDKKSDGGGINMVFLERIGKAVTLPVAFERLPHLMEAGSCE